MSYDEDDLDLDMLSGDGGTVSMGAVDIVGAIERNPALLRKLLRRDARGVIDKNGPPRRKVLNSESGSVAANTTQTFTYETQEKFRPEAFILSDAAQALFVRQITVATQQQFASGGDCPGVVFAKDAFNAGLHFDTAMPGQKIEVQVENPTAAAVVFSGSFIGTSIV